MHSDQRIEDLARELNIDSGTSSSSADRMRKIAESIGMNDFNSIYDVDKLEQKLTEMLSEKRRREVLESEDNKSDNHKDKEKNNVNVIPNLAYVSCTTPLNSANTSSSISGE